MDNFTVSEKEKNLHMTSFDSQNDVIPALQF